MATLQKFRELALALPEVEEKSHFGQADFRVRNRIFAGITKRNTGHVKLSPEQQDVVCESERSVVGPIPGGSGNQGWTEINQSKANTALLKSLLHMGWSNVAPKSLLKFHASKERR